VANTAKELPNASQCEDLPERLELLYRELNPTLVRTLAKRLHDPEAAQEVAQEAYEQIFIRANAAEAADLRAAPLNHLRSYLFKTAQNIAFDRLRMRRRRLRDAHLLSQHAQLDDALSAEGSCIQQQEWIRLRQAVQELPARCRDAFLLVEFECLAVEDVAVRTGVKPNTVNQLCKRAYEHLMRALSEGHEQRGERT